MLVESLLPVFAYFLVGMAARRAELLTAEQSQLVFRLVFNITLPALVFVALADATLPRSAALLPLIAFLMNCICLWVAWLYATRATLSDEDTGLVLLGSCLTNMLIVFAFVQSALPPEAMATAVLFDLGNAVFLSTVASSVALRLSGKVHANRFEALLKLVKSPIFIAMLAGLACSVAGLGLPPLLDVVMRPLGQATIPVTLIALGAVFSLDALKGWPPFVTVVIRMGLGTLVGTGFILMLDPDPLTARVLLVSVAAPIGFSSVALVAVAGLDTRRSAAAVSLSVLVGMVSTTLLLWVGEAWFGS